MSCSSEDSNGRSSPIPSEKKFKGVRRRKWGKWVSEIRVPGTQERLWLGSYSTPEAAAVAHDMAYYCLRRPTTLDNLNFPTMLAATSIEGCTSPTSIQRAASDAGMAVDAQFITRIRNETTTEYNYYYDNMKSENKNYNVVVNDVECWGNCSSWTTTTWEGTTDLKSNGDQALNISIEDYL